jgi:serine/threonine protein kinase
MVLLAPFEQNSGNCVCPDWIDTTLSQVEAAGNTLNLNDSFNDVIRAAREALNFLTRIDEISTTLASGLDLELHELGSRVETLVPHLCHGDLGPCNVMRDQKGLILLDWEDIFLGVRGYDWIYWLSFFSNRHLLTCDNLLRSGLPERVSKAVLLAILLVKCELSVRSGAISGHSMSIDKRLSEALAFK